MASRWGKQSAWLSATRIKNRAGLAFGSVGSGRSPPGTLAPPPLLRRKKTWELSRIIYDFLKLTFKRFGAIAGPLFIYIIYKRNPKEAE